MNPEKVRSALSQIVARGKLPAIQYVVVDSEGIRFRHTVGVKDVKTGEKASDETRFMVSSSTKTITAAAVLQLHDQGKIDIEAGVSDYFDDHPYGNEVKVRHLLNQSSGIPNPIPTKWVHRVQEHESFDENRALADSLSKHSKRGFEPGEKYAYSNISYWLLGKIIETASGQSFEDYIQENVLSLIGVSEGELDFEIGLAGQARGHAKKLSLLGLLTPLLISKQSLADSANGRYRFNHVYMNGSAYGGLVGTATGMAKFLRDQLQEQSRLFSSPTRELFYSEQLDRKGKRMPTTLGWHRGVLNGINYYGKVGGGPGFQSNIRLYPSKGIGTAWLANEAATGEGPVDKLTDKLDSFSL
jgi:CubicO group peptidase (beta-lactamase class C family)